MQRRRFLISIFTLSISTPVVYKLLISRPYDIKLFSCSDPIEQAISEGWVLSKCDN